MAITVEQVKELRELTGAGMMDCKRALEDAQGDREKAVAALREKGLASASKKAARIASEGLVVSALGSGRRVGSLVEVNSETDFVARNQEFASFAQEVAEMVAGAEALGTTVISDGQNISGLKLKSGQTAAEAAAALVAKIGENITVRRFARLAVPEGCGLIESYIHMGGKIGVLIELRCAKADTVKHPEFLALARDLAMQVAASKPEYVRRADVPAEILESEKTIYRAQAVNEGKPAQVVEKIVTGRLEKYYKEVCLLEQAFIKDDERSCAQVIAAAATALGDSLDVGRFARFERGEGLAKRSGDFVAEVRAQLGGQS
ncbi:MAG: translation elongation factor Ts [Patescibacteria group bacterium]